MKTYSGLLQAVAEPANLWSAWLEARKGKRRQPEAAAFEVEAEREIFTLRRRLLDGTYRPEPYRLLVITDPKQRLIAAAPFRDRVVHHAIIQVVHPRYGRRFIHDSYACLPARGSHRAVLRFQDRVRRHRYVMQLDVVRYFQSISWDRVLEVLAHNTSDRAFLHLIERLLESAATIYTDTPQARSVGTARQHLARHGLPIGNYTSQWLGNLFLDGLDHLAKRELKIRAYQRYMDDIAIFSSSKQDLRYWRDAMATWLEEHRGLQLHVERAHSRPCRGRHRYLGFVVTPGGIRPGQRTQRRMRERLPLLLHGDPERLGRSIASYRGSFLL